MRLEELTPALLLKVLEIYDRIAYPNRERKPPLEDFPPPSASPAEVLELFSPLDPDQAAEAAEGPRCFVKQLGNEHYPFMKLLFQEHLHVGWYYFAVDSHDMQEITPDMPDYEAWVRLKKNNRQLKEQIEAAWGEANIPTQRLLDEIGADVEGSPQASAGVRILVAEDEEPQADATARALRASGYEVDVVGDGVRALEAVRLGTPDLLVLDYEMPRCSGIQVIGALDREGLRRFPILLVSGGPVSDLDRCKADCFLGKPFFAQVLIRTVRRLLCQARSGSEPLQPPEESP